MGNRHAAGAVDLLDLDQSVPQCALQRQPDTTVARQCLGAQNQNAAIRLVQGTAPDQAEVGLQGALDLPVLDPAEQVFICRVAFQIDGRRTQISIIDDQIDRITQLRRCDGRTLARLLRLEGVEMVQQVLTHLDEPAAEARPRRELLLHLVQQAGQRLVGGVAFETAQPLQIGRLAVHPPTVQVGQGAGHLGVGGLKVGPLLIRQVGHGLFVLGQGRDEAETALLRLNQRQALVGGRLAQLVQLAADLAVERLRLRLDPRLKALAGEHLLQGFADARDQRRHRIAEPASLSGRQAVGAWPVPMAEIVQIDPVARRIAGDIFRQETQRRAHAPAVVAGQNEDVEPLAPQRQAEFQSLAGPHMAGQRKHGTVDRRPRVELRQPDLVRRQMSCCHVIAFSHDQRAPRPPASITRISW